MTMLLHVPQNSNRPALPQALSRCRVLLAYVHPTFDTDPMSHERGAPAISVAADGFEAAFRPWMSRSAAADRQQNLRAILESAADFHMMLFAQPSYFVYDWATKSAPSTSVVLPGLVKTTDEHGNPLVTAQTVVQPALIDKL
ncbi:hypothetical protein SLS57_007752 [Botryosphaeria dothidea]